MIKYNTALCPSGKIVGKMWLHI